MYTKRVSHKAGNEQEREVHMMFEVKATGPEIRGGGGAHSLRDSRPAAHGEGTHHNTTHYHKEDAAGRKTAVFLRSGKQRGFTLAKLTVLVVAIIVALNMTVILTACGGDNGNVNTGEGPNQNLIPITGNKYEGILVGWGEVGGALSSDSPSEKADSYDVVLDAKLYLQYIEEHYSDGEKLTLVDTISGNPSQINGFAVQVIAKVPEEYGVVYYLRPNPPYPEITLSDGSSFFDNYRDRDVYFSTVRGVIDSKEMRSW
jgi:hypothetical protein